MAACVSAPPAEQGDPKARARVAWADAAEAIESDWSQRDDPEALDRAIAAYEGIIEAHPDAQEIWVRLSRAHYLASQAFPERADPEAQAEAGVDRGEKALNLSPGFVAYLNMGRSIEMVLDDPEAPVDVPALYWYCQNLLTFARTGGLPTLLFYSRRLESCFSRLRADAPEFDGGGPARGHGALKAVLPQFSGQDLKASRSAFDAAGGLDASFWNGVLEAETWAVESGQDRQARDLLEAVVTSTASGPDGRLAQERARWLTRRIGPAEPAAESETLTESGAP